MTALAERNSWAAEGLDDRDACGSGIATVALGDDEPRLPGPAGLSVSVGDRTVRLWETKARGEHGLKGHGGPVRCVDYAPGGGCSAASDDKAVKIWGCRRASSSARSAPAVGQPGAAKSPRLRGGAGSATTSHSNWVSGQVNAWGRSHGLIQHYASHAGPITSIAMEPRAGHYLASSGDDGTLKLYDLRQGQVLYTLRGHEGAATAAAFSPRSTDGELFASGGADKVRRATDRRWRRARGVDRAMLPEVVASTLDHVVGQLDIITSTLAILEQRLSITEDRVSTILKSKTEEPSS
ncbi:hypothetical protein JL721_6595 [Aureococcus anophagefferens]|nr:hypothetical protein JL721_6595 [Aureococcus anophagefferens]